MRGGQAGGALRAAQGARAAGPAGAVLALLVLPLGAVLHPVTHLGQQADYWLFAYK